MPEQRELDASDCVERVEHELAQPLLVDPFAPLAPNRDCVVPWQAVLDDLVASEERKPTVGKKLAWERRDAGREEEGDNRKEQRMLERPIPRRGDRSAKSTLLHACPSRRANAMLYVFHHPRLASNPDAALGSLPKRPDRAGPRGN